MLRSKTNQALPLGSVSLTFDEAGNPGNGHIELIRDGRGFMDIINLELTIGSFVYGPMHAFGEYTYNPGENTTSIPVVMAGQTPWRFQDPYLPGPYLKFGDLLDELDPNLDRTNINWLNNMSVLPNYLASMKDRGREAAENLLSELGYSIIADLPGVSALGKIVEHHGIDDVVFNAPYVFTGESRSNPTIPSRIIVNGCDLDELRRALELGLPDGTKLIDSPESHEAIDKDAKFTDSTIGKPTVTVVDAAPPTKEGNNPVPTELFKRIKVTFKGVANAYRTELQVARPTDEQRFDMELGGVPAAQYPQGSWESLAQVKGTDSGEAYITNPGMGTYAFRIVSINPRKSVYRDTGYRHYELSYGTPGLPVTTTVGFAGSIGLRAVAMDGRIALAWNSQTGSRYKLSAKQLGATPGSVVMGGQPNPQPTEVTGYGAAWLEGLESDTRWEITVQRLLDTTGDVIATDRVTVIVPLIGKKLEDLALTPSSNGAKLEWPGTDKYTIEVTRDGKSLTKIADASLSPKLKVVSGKNKISVGGLQPSTEYTLSVWPIKGRGYDDRYVLKRQFTTKPAIDPEAKTDEEKFADKEIDTYTQTSTVDGMTTKHTATRGSDGSITNKTTVSGTLKVVKTKKGSDGKYTAETTSYPNTVISDSTEISTLDAEDRETTVNSTKKGYGYRSGQYKLLTQVVSTVKNSWNPEGYCVSITRSDRETELGADGSTMVDSRTLVTQESWVRTSKAGAWTRSLQGHETAPGPQYNPTTGAVVGIESITRPISETSTGYDAPRRQKPKEAPEIPADTETPTEPHPAPKWNQLSVTEGKSELVRAAAAAESDDQRKAREAQQPIKTLTYTLEVGGPGPVHEVNVPWCYYLADLATIAQYVKNSIKPTITRTRVYLQPVGARRTSTVKAVEIRDGEGGFSETVTTRSVG